MLEPYFFTNFSYASGSEDLDNKELFNGSFFSYFWLDRRKINIEQKAKVVAAVWWTEFIQFLATLVVLN